MKADVLTFTCPTCGARMGEWCSTGQHAPHRARVAKVPKTRQPGQKRAGSVRAIPSAFESNRRRH